MNNTLDLTMYRIARHTGLRKLRKQLKFDLKTVFKQPLEEKENYCSCEPPEFKQNDDLEWTCQNCDRRAEPYEPGEEII